RGLHRRPDRPGHGELRSRLRRGLDPRRSRRAARAGPDLGRPAGPRAHGAASALGRAVGGRLIEAPSGVVAAPAPPLTQPSPRKRGEGYGPLPPRSERGEGWVRGGSAFPPAERFSQYPKRKNGAGWL